MHNFFFNNIFLNVLSGVLKLFVLIERWRSAVNNNCCAFNIEILQRLFIDLVVITLSLFSLCQFVTVLKSFN